GGWIGVRRLQRGAGRALVTLELPPRDLVYAEGERVAKDDAVDPFVVVAVCLSRGRAHEELAGGADRQRQSILTDRGQEPRSTAVRVIGEGCAVHRGGLLSQTPNA